MPKKQIAVVVIPTYNEVDSIGKMIDHLFQKTFPSIKDWHCKLLVVDDTSPDGTYKIVQKKQKKYPDLYLLLNKTKAGIGNAYVRGFKKAIKSLHADVLIEFDSDFQHPPQTIPVMLREINRGADYVLGSRKIKGGSNPKGWGFKRVFFSEVGGFMARFILFFPFKNFFRVTDPTTGLKASRVKGFVDRMDTEHLYSKKFGYKLEFLFKMILLGAKVKEIPLKFGLRTAGESKISGSTASDIFKTVVQLRFKDDPFVQKFLKFGIVGGFGFIVNVLGAKLFKPIIMTNINLNVSFVNSIANALAAELSIISNFILNNLWTFSQDKITKSSQVLTKFLTFNISSIITGIVIPSSIIGILTVLFGDRLFLYQVITILGLTVPLNWFVYNKFIWKKK